MRKIAVLAAVSVALLSAPAYAQEPEPCPQNVSLELSAVYQMSDPPEAPGLFTRTVVIRAVYLYGEGYERREVPDGCRGAYGSGVVWSVSSGQPYVSQLGFDPWRVVWRPTPGAAHNVQACVKHPDHDVTVVSIVPTFNAPVCAWTKVYVD